MSLNKSLQDTATRIFESLWFMIPDDADESERAVSGERVRVRFHGPFDGALDVIAGADVAAEITEQSAIETGVRSDDVIGELANLICGNLLPEVAGHDEVFVLSAPEIAASADEPAEVAAGTALRFGDHWVRVELLVDADALQQLPTATP